MNFKPCFPGSETLLLGASPQRCANRGLICWLVVLPYLMGARTQLYIRAHRFITRGERPWVPRPRSNAEAIASILEVGQSSRPIPNFAGRKDTLNPPERVQLTPGASGA